MAKKRKTNNPKATPDEAKDVAAKVDEIASASADAKDDEFIEDLEGTTDDLKAEGAETIEAAFSDGAPDAAEKPVEDAEIVEETVAEAEATETPDESGKADESQDAATADETAESAEAEASDAPEPAPETETPEIEAAAEPAPEPKPDPKPEPAAPPVQHITEVRKAGFMPLFLGGVIAAALGAGAIYYSGALGEDGTDLAALEAALAAQTAEIEALKTELAGATEANAALEAQIAAIPSVDLSGLEASVGSLGETDSATQAELGTLSAALAETRARLAELEVQPIPEAVIPEEATAAYERELAEMLATIEGRFNDMQSAQAEELAKLEGQITARLDELAALQAEASATEEAALIAANKAAAQAAAARIAVALDSGEGFAEQLAVLNEKGGIDAPAVLADTAADGVTTLSMLQQEFPPIARAVLANVDRNAGAEEGSGALTSIILTQLGARSLAPHEGNDPDAVLSRAEAALNAGELETTLTELAALPEEAQPYVADWVALATTLKEARAASDALTAELNQE